MNFYSLTDVGEDFKCSKKKGRSGELKKWETETETKFEK